jgi:hypothetical protein
MTGSSGSGDFDFLFGVWKVDHRKLKRRLAGDDSWDEFEGDCACRPMHFGIGNFEDNRFHLPDGFHAASAVRYFNPATAQWAIYWVDSRRLSVEPPVLGGFADGVGLFFTDDTFEGRPIRVRFIWSHMTPTSARWEQAFSPDGGASWEINWVMEFTRIAT